MKFPSHIVQTQAATRLSTSMSATCSRAAPARALTSRRLRPPRRQLSEDRAAENRRRVLFLDGGAPMSVLVEFSDHVVIIEGPQATSARKRRWLP
jgi:hypothetical protein